MKTRFTFAHIEIFRFNSRAKFFILASLLVFTTFGSGTASAQHKMSKRYPAGKNVRVELKNISGTITVESWNRNEIKLTAVLESPKANLAPRQDGDGLFVDVMGDNRGRGDVGSINFHLQVPVNSSVDLETKMGGITVRNISGGLVRAHVSSEGDIELTGITASRVYAKNRIGDIFFDGEFARDGEYHLQSGKGNINIRIPANSAFSLTAAAPNKQINIGAFWNNGFKSMGDGRKFVGNVGGGQSEVVVTNFQGSITFLRR
jgi:DUF4097 and DUF4098 domain-containing protein YvlB